MNGIWVALSRPISEAGVHALLERWFPAVEVFTQEAALRSDRKPWPPIVFSVEKREGVPDFSTYIGFDCFPGPGDDAVGAGIVLSRRFAATLACKAICDGTGFGDDQSPYWSIIWDCEQSFLADDCNTAFADGKGGHVQVVRALQLPGLDLDERGTLLAHLKSG